MLTSFLVFSIIAANTTSIVATQQLENKERTIGLKVRVREENEREEMKGNMMKGRMRRRKKERIKGKEEWLNEERMEGKVTKRKVESME